MAPADSALGTALCSVLKEVGISAVHVTSAAQAVAFLGQAKVDLVVVEIGTGFPDGSPLIGQLKALAYPVVVLAAMEDVGRLADALQDGADDYLTAIPAATTLLALVASAVQPGGSGPEPPHASILRVGDLAVDLQRHAVFVGDEPLALSPGEFRLLTVLTQPAGEARSVQSLAQEALDLQVPEQEARTMLKSHVHRLRAKLATATADPPIIVAVRGFGYRLDRRAAPRPGTASPDWAPRRDDSYQLASGF